MLDEKGKEYFTGWIIWCEIGTQYIPLSFLLGFFVAVIVARWWEQFNWVGGCDRVLSSFLIFLDKLARQNDDGW
jgi:hypothetical protein